MVFIQTLKKIHIATKKHKGYPIYKFNLCRNPNLAKCGGEAQHLEKVRIWSLPRLPNV
jgi:hypothetical protein